MYNRQSESRFADPAKDGFEPRFPRVSDRKGTQCLGRSGAPVGQRPTVKVRCIGEKRPGGKEAACRRHRRRTGLLESRINADVGLRQLGVCQSAPATRPATAKPIACTNSLYLHGFVPLMRANLSPPYGARNSVGGAAADYPLMFGQLSQSCLDPMNGNVIAIEIAWL